MVLKLSLFGVEEGENNKKINLNKGKKGEENITKPGRKKSSVNYSRSKLL